MTSISCTLEDEDRGSRRTRWLVLGARALVGVETTSRGLQLVFAAEPGLENELAELAALERECCAFATWNVHGDGTRVVLDVAGKGDDAVPAVQSMFVPLRGLVRPSSAPA